MENFRFSRRSLAFTHRSMALNWFYEPWCLSEMRSFSPAPDLNVLYPWNFTRSSIPPELSPCFFFWFSDASVLSYLVWKAWSVFLILTLSVSVRVFVCALLGQCLDAKFPAIGWGHSKSKLTPGRFCTSPLLFDLLRHASNSIHPCSTSHGHCVP